MTKTIDLLALLRVRMHHGTWDAPGNESAGAFPGIVKHTTPRKHAWVRGTPTPRKGLPRAQINVGAAPRTTKMRHKARGKKCSLGLQVTVEAEAGLFWQQRRKQLWPLSHRKQPPVLVAQDPRRSCGAAQPAAESQRLGTAPSVSSPPGEGGRPRAAKTRSTAGTRRQRCLWKRATPASSTS